ncbi:S1C family serine protease [Arthrobacter monumenti]
MTEQHGSGYGPQRPTPPQGFPPQPQTPPSNAPRYGQYQQPAGPPSYGENVPHQPDGDNGQQFGGMPPGNQFQDRSPRDKKKYGPTTLISGMLIAGLIGGGVAVGADALLDDGSQAAPASNATAQSPVIVNDQENVNAVTAAAQKASPSVVTISVAGQQASGTGSGIILDREGHILTNTHVVTLGGQSSETNVEVRTNDGRVHSAEIVGTDPFSDLAVIKIDAGGLTPAALADSKDLNVGDTAIAIGAPLGLSGTVTDGIISTLNRTIRVASSAVPETQPDGPQRGTPDDQGWNFAPPDGSQTPQSSSQGAVYINVIQTDAAINHGNSGGALVNADGEVIGVNVAIASGSETGGNIGVGFSIPIDYAERVAQEIIADGEATHGFLGVSVTAKASEESEGRTAFSVGAEVAEVVEGSPADQAGLQTGDVITDVSGINIGDGEALTAVVRQQAQGETVQLSYLRGGEPMSTEVTLGDADLS